jgi:hypothetical protein
MTQALRTALITAAAFFAGHIGITVLIAAWQFLGTRSVRGNEIDSYAMMLFIVVFSGTVSAFAYAAITACSRRWRERRLRTVVIVSAVAGAIALAGTWVGLFVPVLGLLHAAFGSVAAIRISTAVPGVILGIVVLAWSLTAAPGDRARPV